MTIVRVQITMTNIASSHLIAPYLTWCGATSFHLILIVLIGHSSDEMRSNQMS